MFALPLFSFTIATASFFTVAFYHDIEIALSFLYSFSFTPFFPRYFIDADALLLVVVLLQYMFQLPVELNVLLLNCRHCFLSGFFTKQVCVWFPSNFSNSFARAVYVIRAALSVGVPPPRLSIIPSNASEAVEMAVEMG